MIESLPDFERPISAEAIATGVDNGKSGFSAKRLRIIAKYPTQSSRPKAQGQKLLFA